MSYTRGPWRLRLHRCSERAVVGPGGTPICVAREAEAKRIVLAVNSVEQFSDDALGSGALDDLLAAAQRVLGELAAVAAVNPAARPSMDQLYDAVYRLRS